MTRISPALLARIVDALAPRVRKRADAYLADGVEVGPTTQVAGASVRLAGAGVLTEDDQIVCDCLLAPRCAHRAVVALSLEVAGDGDGPTPGEAPAGARAPRSGTGSPA
ncbi:hypothetical protein HMPREF1550_02624, partial [Actinomyces sp. oral taxon 877 str. F0543]